jgi:hypothetical protein
MVASKILVKTGIRYSTQDGPKLGAKLRVTEDVMTLHLQVVGSSALPACLLIRDSASE